MGTDVDRLIERVGERYPEQPEFVQAVEQTLRHLEPMAERDSRFGDASLFERIVEPDRMIQFRVEWEDDERRIRVNRGYRVQWSDALGPYKGGLRFQPTVGPSVLKFLAFEQTFKNALTGLGIGGGKGGADFDPREASDAEIRRFCHSFMTELQRHVSPERDVPAGDIGVGPREIGYLYGQYKRLRPDASEAFTGKPLELSGSPLRQEATGWGVVYLAARVLDRRDESLEERRCLLSGAGNVAVHTAEKLIDVGARVLTLSDRHGFVHVPEGLSREDLDCLRSIKGRRGSVSEFAEQSGYVYGEGRPWRIPCDVAFPCATQNELEEADADALVGGGCSFVCEGANMPCTDAARARLREADVLFVPGNAANAGGVAVSEFEMAQAASRQRWQRDEVDRRLRSVMQSIHDQCVRYGEEEDGRIDYAAGATRAGFARLAAAMLRF
jgi:glutamate dehydrogenase (NADP+)